MIFFENILDELSAKILVTDDNLDVLFLNKSAEDYLCATLEESRGKNIDKVFKEKISNELELQEILEKKKSLKRHITTIFLKDNLQKKSLLSLLPTLLMKNLKELFLNFLIILLPNLKRYPHRQIIVTVFPSNILLSLIE